MGRGVAGVVNEAPGGVLLDPPDWPWQAISAVLAAPYAPRTHIELRYRASEAVCRYIVSGEARREESFVGGTFRQLDVQARRAVVRLREPTARAMRQVTEPFLGPLRAVQEGGYRQRDSKSLEGSSTYVNRNLVLSLVELRPDGLPRRVRQPNGEIKWQSLSRSTSTEPPTALVPTEDWTVEEYRRLEASEFFGDKAPAIAGLPVYEMFEYQSPLMPTPYRTAIWKHGPDEIKLVTGEGHGTGPTGAIREARSVRTRTPDRFTYVYASSAELLESAVDALDGVAGFDARIVRQSKMGERPLASEWILTDSGPVQDIIHDEPPANRRERTAGDDE